MKISRMTDPKGKPPSPKPNKSHATDTAFDNWLNRGLHKIFDDVMNEPLPPELLKLIQGDKKK